MNQISRVENPFGKQITPAANNAIARAESERSIEEVRAAMVIAKQFPRDQIKAMDRILNSCMRESLANTALYCYPRGGQDVTGPSIRLAEALAQQWGNIQFGIRELSNEGGMSTVEAFAWDVESNTKQTKIFQVKHWRDTRNGGYALKDTRDIYELVANQGARRMRACILGVIPGDVVEKAVDQCCLTQSNTVDVTPDAIKKMLDSFEVYGIEKEHIEKRISKRTEAINAPQMLSLRNIFASLKDGMSKPSDWFDMVETEEGETKTSDIAEMVNKKKTKEPAEECPLSLFDNLLMETKDAEHAEALKNGTAYKKLTKTQKAEADKKIDARVQAFEATQE